MTARTVALIECLFSAEQREEVTWLLREECGTNLPFCQQLDDVQLERYRFAALKISNSNIEKLWRAIQVAKEDWRDLLMAAGFGHSVTEHERWAEEILSEKR